MYCNVLLIALLIECIGENRKKYLIDNSVGINADHTECCKFRSSHSVHSGMNLPPQTPPPPLSCHAPLKSVNCLSPSS